MVHELHLSDADFLDAALQIATDIVGMAACLKRRVSCDGPNSLLDLTLDLMADTLSVEFGFSGFLGGIRLCLLRGSVGGEIGVTNGVTDGLLGSSDVGVGGVRDLISEVGHGWLLW